MRDIMNQLGEDFCEGIKCMGSAYLMGVCLNQLGKLKGRNIMYGNVSSMGDIPNQWGGKTKDKELSFWVNNIFTGTIV